MKINNITNYACDMKKTLAIILAMAFLPLMILAHEGHGSTEGFTVIHYIIEPLHVPIVILIITIAVIIFLRRNRSVKE